ncbi:MAG: DNA polymerase II large subunit, partial [Candidatus Aenigmarchaeota archaeon]|nr:DNA polymerase II large subunit [Candidatus Aenigmarchaeota archaeon]
EVSNFKDLARVETNKIRGGMCLVLLDGIPLKAEKIVGRLKKYPAEYQLQNWLWLEKFIELKHKIHAAKKTESDDKYTPNKKYMSKVIAGRPVMAFPATPGGFRLRYGRARTGGLAAVALHPGIMHLSEFLAIGTQIATELPGKASVCSACSTIAPPVVLLKNGDVVEVHTKDDATQHKKNIKKYLSMGDMLVPFGEFVSNNHVLLPSSYVEEWWVQDVAAAEKSKGLAPRKDAFMEKPYPAPSFDDALAISKQLGVPLHPRYNFFWHDLTIDDVCALIEWFSKANVSEDKISLSNAPEKELLEKLCVPHSMQDERVVLDAFAKPIYFTLGKPTPANKDALTKVARGFEDTLHAVSALMGVTIRAHGPTRVGVKMG